MTASDSSSLVRHNVDLKRFELQAEHGPLAFLTYVVEGATVIYDHTFVPHELRGRGMAALLVRAALEEAGQQGWKVVPRCSYVARFMERHPEFANLLHRR